MIERRARTTSACAVSNRQPCGHQIERLSSRGARCRQKAKPNGSGPPRSPASAPRTESLLLARGRRRKEGERPAISPCGAVSESVGGKASGAPFAARQFSPGQRQKSLARGRAGSGRSSTVASGATLGSRAAYRARRASRSRGRPPPSNPPARAGSQRGPSRAARRGCLLRCVRPALLLTLATGRLAAATARSSSGRPCPGRWRCSMRRAVRLRAAPKRSPRSARGGLRVRGAAGRPFGPSVLAAQPPAPFLCGPGPFLADPQRRAESFSSGASPRAPCRPAIFADHKSEAGDPRPGRKPVVRRRARQAAGRGA
jgi:hypothetical protein